jgi:capsular polysaccharide transport system permease protein
MNQKPEALKQASSPESRISWPGPFLDLACAVAQQKLIVTAIVIAGVILGILRLIIMPDVYTSSSVAVLLPREKPMLDAAIDTSSIETSDDRAARSSSGNLMLPPNPTLYTTLIFSRPVLSKVAATYGERLQGHVSPRDRSEEVIGQIRSMLKVSSTEEGLITITVTSQDGQLSADIANELFAECREASRSIERQLILQQAGHLEEALSSSMERLRETEKRLSNFTATNGVVDVDMQASNQLRSIRELSSERDKLEADMQELLLTYSENSPEVRRLRLRMKILDRQQAGNATNIVGSIGTSEFGQLMVAHESLKQRIRFERDLVATLATKADLYKLRAEEPIGNLAVIRPAIAQSRPSGPSKKRELGLAMSLSLIVGFGWAILAWQWNSVLSDSYFSARVRELMELLIPRAWPGRKAILNRIGI